MQWNRHHYFMRRLAVLALFIVLCCCAATQTTIDKKDYSSVSPSLALDLKRLVLHDFNRSILTNNVGGECEALLINPDVTLGRVQWTLETSEKRGASGHALHLSYALPPDTTSQTCFRTSLQGLDASGYDHLEFWIKGDARRGYAPTLRALFLRPEDGMPQRMQRGSYVVSGITDEWQRIRVPLRVMNGIQTWTHLDTFAFSWHSRRSKVKSGAYYLDDIALVKTGQPGPSGRDEVVPEKKREWEKARGGEEASKPYLQARLVGWPTTALIDPSQLPKDDEAFLRRLAHDTWRGLDDLTDREHGLPLDTVSFGTDSVALAHSRIHDYTNITNIGLYLMGVIAAHDFGFLTPQETLRRLTKTISTLEMLKTYQGFFYNYYNTTTLERTSHFISFVDSAWLTAGLMVVRMAYPAFYNRATRLIEQTDYAWLYDPVEQLMSHGYYANLRYPSEYHYGLLYSESRIGSLIAIGKGDVPEAHWFQMWRTFPVAYAWQSQPPLARQGKSVRGHHLKGGYYEWQGMKFVPSWGGSMFEALMPTLVVDEQHYAPHSLGANNRVHATIHRRYALKELNYRVWGMSPSSAVLGNRYEVYGVNVLGVSGYPSGIVTPHASALALSTTPQAAIRNLRKLVTLYDIYGEYGFYDAVNPRTGDVASKYLALNQAMILIALANYLLDGCIQRYFANDPIAAKSLQMLGAERFFD